MLGLAGNEFPAHGLSFYALLRPVSHYASLRTIQNVKSEIRNSFYEYNVSPLLRR